MTGYGRSFIKAIILSHVISMAAIMVLAMILYQFDLQDAQLRMGMLGVYALSCLAGGFFIGRKTKKRQYLGGLFVGLMYFAIHMAGVIAMEGIEPERIVPATALAIMCMASGMMGGALVQNQKINNKKAFN